MLSVRNLSPGVQGEHAKDAPAETPSAPASEHRAAPAQVQPLGPRPDTGLLSLTTIAGHYRIAADAAQIGHDLGLGTRTATGEEIVRAATRIGLKSRVLRKQAVGRLNTVPAP